MEIRYIIPKDYKWLYKLRNEPSVRKQFFNTQKVSWKEHLNYWKNFDSFACAIFEGNTPLGLVRIIDDNISIAIFPKYRRKGIAYKALSQLDIKGIAEIKPDNTPSINLFKKLGFKITKIVMEK